MKNKKYLIERADGRLYGPSIWTYDERRAVLFPSKEAAEEKARGFVYETNVRPPI